MPLFHLKWCCWWLVLCKTTSICYVCWLSDGPTIFPSLFMPCTATCCVCLCMASSVCMCVPQNFIEIYSSKRNYHCEIPALWFEYYCKFYGILDDVFFFLQRYHNRSNLFHICVFRYSFIIHIQNPETGIPPLFVSFVREYEHRICIHMFEMDTFVFSPIVISHWPSEQIQLNRWIKLQCLEQGDLTM